MRAFTISVVLLLGSPYAEATPSRIGAISLAIEESGPTDNPAFDLLFEQNLGPFDSPERLTSPSGEVFDVTGSSLQGSVLRSFTSFDDAFGFLEGTWRVDLEDSPFAAPSSVRDYDFTVAEITPDSVIRELPTLLSPTPSQVVLNGSTVVLAFDYEAGPSEPSSATLELTSPFSSAADGVFFTLRRTGIGDADVFLARNSFAANGQRLDTELQLVPGAEEFQFLYTLTASESVLPFDVQLALGGPESDLSDSVTLGDVSDVDLAGGEISVALRYTRFGTPFTITLSNVPEPTTASLLSATLIAGLAFGRRRRVG